MADSAVKHNKSMTAPPLDLSAVHGARVAAAVLVCGSAVLLFALENRPWGYAALGAGIVLASFVDRVLARHLGLIALGQVIISTIPLKADLSNPGISRFAVALGLAVCVPYAISRWVLRDHVIRFTMRGGWPWTRVQWGYIAVVVVAAYLILPYYFIGSGVYRNWPDVTGPDQITRLFVGVNAVGIWDEIFFIATVFVLLLRHFPVWLANLLQATVFVSFLWELGYREWGPALTVPFALIQGWIFSWARSLPYVITVHLLFDAVVFGVLVHAHNPAVFDIFVTAP